nr:GAF domain-containing sensor histidine kinase [Pelagicoccus albus]
MDTPPDDAFDRISAFAARRFGVPVALVTLIGKDKQFIRSCYGIDVRETTREMAFCAHTIASPDQPVVVEDATKDPRFKEHPMVVGDPGIRFYAGVPLMAQEHSAIGSFCLVDWKPRSFSPEELRDLKDLACFVEDQIRLHDSRNKTRQSDHEIRSLNNTMERSMEELKNCLKRSIPHELRTPLNGLVGFSKILWKNWKVLPEDEVARILDFLCLSGERLDRSVRRLCMLNELQIIASDRDEILALRDCDPISLKSSVDSALCDVAALENRWSDLEVSVEPVLVASPEGHFSAMLGELLENAAKFSSPGTVISIEGSREKAGYRLIVRDHGRGMTQEQIERLDDFVQFDREIHEQQGMGLGLSLVSRLCALLGIGFTLESPRRDGLKVTLRIPASLLS